MSVHQETVTICSNGAALAGVLFLPTSDRPSPALILCHGALEFKENWFEFCEFLAARGVAACAIDMHGHGQSEGERFHLGFTVPDVRDDSFPKTALIYSEVTMLPSERYRQPDAGAMLTVRQGN